MSFVVLFSPFQFCRCLRQPLGHACIVWEVGGGCLWSDVWVSSALVSTRNVFPKQKCSSFPSKTELHWSIPSYFVFNSRFCFCRPVLRFRIQFCDWGNQGTQGLSYKQKVQWFSTQISRVVHTSKVGELLQINGLYLSQLPLLIL